MPIFEYRCKTCGHVTAFLEKWDSEQAHACEKCGSQDTEKIFSSFAVKASHTYSDNTACPTGTCPLT